MPIHPSMKALYPPDWPQISARIRFERAGNRCEWCGYVGQGDKFRACPGPDDDDEAHDATWMLVAGAEREDK